MLEPHGSYTNNYNDRRRGTSGQNNTRPSSLYERYNVNIPSDSGSSYSSHGSSSHGSRRRKRSNRRSTLALAADTEGHYYQRHQRNQRLLFYLVVILLSVAIWMTNQSDVASVAIIASNNNTTATLSSSNKIVRMGSSYVNLNLSQRSASNNHQQSNKQKVLEKQQIQHDIETVKTHKKRWNPCLNTKYELERHDYEKQHGDICRVKGGIMGLYECPDGCHETAGNAPYCANDGTGGSSNNALPKTNGRKGGPCRVRNPDAPPEYRCDDGGVCIMAVGTPKSQFKGEGVYYDDSCDGQCGDGMDGDLTTWIANGRKCTSDWDCSLAGICTPADGTCECDPWAQGVDCSYLKFQAVDRTRLGYLDEQQTSWGGSIVQSAATGLYHMFLSEILCKVDSRRRCGLSAWQTHSRIVEATSTEVDGPFKRLKVVLPPEHHNPSVHISPTTGHWHLFTIGGPTGPIERIISTDEGRTWSNPMTISPEQNPGPVMMPDGTTRLFYRGDGMDIPSPTCSDEGISMQICPSDKEPCHPSNGTPIISHTGEDPSVFIDHRGNYHMLFNALPYKCVPKLQQGGHAWSKDGIEWSTPRVGAFDTTIQFTDGSSMKCERRERPQMVLGEDKLPLAMISAVTGCPRSLGEEESDRESNPYRGGDDSFTLIQKMGK